MEWEIGLVSTIADDQNRTVVALRNYQLLVLDTNKEVMVLRVPETVLEGTIAEKKPGVEGGWQVVATTEDMAETYDGEIHTVEEIGDDRVYRCEMGFD